MAGPSYDMPNGSQRQPQLECRRCGVICERVVYPTHCLRSNCPYVYAFDDGETSFFGCVAKVFSVELDLAPYRPASARDVYGALKTQRPPREHCHVEIEQAYRGKYSWQRCENPIFLHHPDEYSVEAIRLLVNGSKSAPAGDEPACAPADGEAPDSGD